MTIKASLVIDHYVPAEIDGEEINIGVLKLENIEWH